MAVFDKSRFAFCQQWFDEAGHVFLDDRKPFSYRAFADNTLHVVQVGDTIFSIAGSHFRPLPRAAGLWWVIADFQPNPIHDPTIKLVEGSVLVLPSSRTVIEEIFSEARRTESRL